MMKERTKQRKRSRARAAIDHYFRYGGRKYTNDCWNAWWSFYPALRPILSLPRKEAVAHPDAKLLVRLGECVYHGNEAFFDKYPRLYERYRYGR